MSLLSCRNLSVGYAGNTVLWDVSFEVNPGDYLCIVGENGSGKSTLMRTILGLQPPTGGALEVSNKSGIGYVPQQTAAQKDFPASVWEIVLSGCMSRKPFYDRVDKALARRNIERLGITPLTHRCFRELSGGQQQRVLLARALCATDQMLLLDEPTTGLDPTATADLYALLEDLNKKQGVTIIMITHDTQTALWYASHILHVGAVSEFTVNGGKTTCHN